ncbi:MULTISPECIES: hypothetical protein [unclassified Agrococcus]|uniref:hypothetical protein n=1 Tax=unclassified Agrococcus TaxID=2615065 RepID=UPI0036231565
MDDDDEAAFDYFAPDIVEARADVGRAINAYLQLIRPGENAFPVAWVAAVEWTNTDLEQAARASRDIVSPSEQAIAASCGLGVYLTNRFG